MNNCTECVWCNVRQYADKEVSGEETFYTFNCSRLKKEIYKPRYTACVMWEAKKDETIRQAD